MSVGTHSLAYTRVHSANYVSDKIQILLKLLICEYGLEMSQLVGDWAVLGRGMNAWLNSGHLQSVTIEFFERQSATLSTRWDFTIGYDGNGAPDDMWEDREHLRRTIDKAPRPSGSCVYRVVLSTAPEAPHIDGFVSTSFRETSGLAARAAGTAVATHDIVAGMQYWRQT